MSTYKKYHSTNNNLTWLNKSTNRIIAETGYTILPPNSLDSERRLSGSFQITTTVNYNFLSSANLTVATKPSLCLLKNPAKSNDPSTTKESSNP